ncbi:MAG: Hint domain-containing protein [Octadecabacter sp.]
MTVMTGSGFYLSTALGVSGTGAQGTVIGAGTLGQIYDIRTDGTNTPANSIMNNGDSITVDTDDDGDFSDETAVTQTDNDRYINSTITYGDGTTSLATIELITLSDGTQTMLVQDGYISAINTATAPIFSITLGTFNTTYNNRYHQGNFNNTITNTVICFSDETLIATPDGKRAIGTLTAGDMVMTADNGAQKIVWIGARTLSGADLISAPNLRPVRIRAGALGDGVPHVDLFVSPQHRILLVSKIAERMFGARRVLVPAIKLVTMAGIDQVAAIKPVTYVHVLLQDHNILFANGAPAESMYAGEEALRSLSPDARKEIFTLFPEFNNAQDPAPLAHKCVRRNADVQALLQRHKKNAKPLVTGDMN